MRAIRAISATLLGVGALASLTACTTAAASNNVSGAAFSYKLTPETVSPGGRLSLPVRGCNGDATVVSGVFSQVTIPKGQSTATATVDKNARPGTSYDVTFQCGHEYGHKKLAIVAAQDEHATAGGAAGNQFAGYRGDQGGGYGGGGYGGIQGGGGGFGGGGYGGIGGGYGGIGGGYGGIGGGGGGYGGGGYGGGGYGGGGGGYGGGGGGGGGYGGGDGGYGGRGGGGYGGGGGGGYGGNQGGGKGYEGHGVSAGLGGSVSSFHPKEVALGAALIGGTVGVAWRMSRRRVNRGS
ncbi:hypothetical protein ABZ845_15975 [Streptomyces sp. NPDC047022]|uniref:hypothetical protein n=1 Tax=Streptomyces sp. NPDC047022 TaxID=3155737 RepID=UPI00340EED5C